jgi:hypothetical protein
VLPEPDPPPPAATERIYAPTAPDGLLQVAFAVYVFTVICPAAAQDGIDEETFRYVPSPPIPSFCSVFSDDAYRISPVVVSTLFALEPQDTPLLPFDCNTRFELAEVEFICDVFTDPDAIFADVIDPSTICDVPTRLRSEVVSIAIMQSPSQTH